MPAPQRGEVWLVDLGLAAKVRPALVLSVPAADIDRALATLVPHTTSPRQSRFEVTVSVSFLRTGVSMRKASSPFRMRSSSSDSANYPRFSSRRLNAAFASGLGLPRQVRGPNHKLRLSSISNRAMSGTAKRIQALRNRTGKTSDEIALLVGLEGMAYFDLEAYDDELVKALSLEQVRRLAEVLGVSTQMLFADEPATNVRSTSYADLVSLVGARIAQSGNQEAFESELGWDLGAFLESEATALSTYGVDFLQSLCANVGVDWMTALP